MDINDFMSSKEVQKFFTTERDKITRLLIKSYSLNMTQAQDAFQNGCMALLENIKSGKLVHKDMTCSLSTYLTSCCINYAHKEVDAVKRNAYDDSKIENLLKIIDDDDEQREDDINLMYKIIQSLPFPCEDLLWGKYFHHFSMTELASRLGYINSRVAITTKNKCMNKLKRKFYSLRETEQ